MAGVIGRFAVVLAVSPYRVAALHIVFGAHNVPHPAKAAKGGEDAFFADDHLGMFGIADGVGGSARGGVDPGLFSREALQRCHLSATFEGGRHGPTLKAALKTATECPMVLPGSTTLLLGQLEASSETLRLFNLGDSGAMLLRPSLREFGEAKVLFPRCVLRSQDQNHGFNYPFQASSRNFDSILDELDVICTDVKEGDVLVAATDGVLDNLFDVDVQASVSEQLRVLSGDDPLAAQEAIEQLAKTIAERASAVGQQQGVQGLKTPFMQAAADEDHPFRGGGKLDDVAIVCGVVRRGQRPGAKLVHNFGGPKTSSVGSGIAHSLQPAAVHGMVTPTTTQQLPQAPPQGQLQAPLAQAPPQHAPPQYAPPQGQLQAPVVAVVQSTGQTLPTGATRGRGRASSSPPTYAPPQAQPAYEASSMDAPRTRGRASGSHPPPEPQAPPPQFYARRRTTFEAPLSANPATDGLSYAENDEWNRSRQRWKSGRRTGARS